jgi:hypothetical protein
VGGNLDLSDIDRRVLEIDCKSNGLSRELLDLLRSIKAKSLSIEFRFEGGDGGRKGLLMTEEWKQICWPARSGMLVAEIRLIGGSNWWNQSSMLRVEREGNEKGKGLKTNMKGGGKLPEDWRCSLLIVGEISSDNRLAGIQTSLFPQISYNLQTKFPRKSSTFLL